MPEPKVSWVATARESKLTTNWKSFSSLSTTHELGCTRSAEGRSVRLANRSLFRIENIAAIIIFRPWLQGMEVHLDHDPKPWSFVCRLYVVDSHLIGICPGPNQQHGRVDEGLFVFEASRNLRGMLTSLGRISQRSCG
jgi:hypothetical protein